MHGVGQHRNFETRAGTLDKFGSSESLLSAIPSTKVGATAERALKWSCERLRLGRPSC
jgi:hypothetical protein